MKKLRSYKLVEDFEYWANKNGDYYGADKESQTESAKAKEKLVKMIARDKKLIRELQSRLTIENK